MTTSTHLPRPVQMLQASTLCLAGTAAPQLTREHQLAMDRVWRAATKANPELFDGPAVVCTAAEQAGQTLVLHWSPVTYRWFALRHVPAGKVERNLGGSLRARTGVHPVTGEAGRGNATAARARWVRAAVTAGRQDLRR
ncbi:hypothetical protein ACIRVF_23350 [Kitasatospora sp. NPDC101157]|uniref:hypothetical protein n=1 Tax=Kitasatospora sp. NPDC101157 TaxID=3364098 RepID=UPI00380ACEDE